MRPAYFLVSVVVLAGFITAPALADLTYSDSLGINQNLSVFIGLNSGPYQYEHSNPYESVGGHSPAEWLNAAESGLVSAVDLTLDFSGVGVNEAIRVEIDANGSGWTELGWVRGSDPYTFNLLDPAYGFGPTGGVDGLPVSLRLLGRDDGEARIVGVNASAMLDTSTLSISVIPVPGAFLLGGLGLALVGLGKWRSR